MCYSEIWPKKVFLHDGISAVKINIIVLCTFICITIFYLFASVDV